MSLSDNERGVAWAKKVERKHKKDSTRERLIAWAYIHSDHVESERHARRA